MIKVPFIKLGALVLFLTLMEEEYPFSHFPMYKNFSQETSVIYVVDDEGEIVPAFTEFGFKTSNTKKKFKAALKNLRKNALENGQTLTEAQEVELEKQAAEEVLNALWKRRQLKRVSRPPLEVGQLVLMEEKISLGPSRDFASRKKRLGSIELTENPGTSQGKP